MEPIIVSKLYDAPPDKVWSALSEESELRKWYFPVENYKFETGKEFTFYGSDDSKEYFHRCRFLNIIPGRSIEYTWEHPNDSKGSSVVKWETEARDGKTLVTLTHAGTETFADAGPTFVRENYLMGWGSVLSNGLRNHLYGIEKLVFEVDINALPEKIWHVMWDKNSYARWTEPFGAGSYFLGELKQGGRIQFLTPSGEGMYSDVAFLKENRFLVLSHIGMIKDGKELPLDPETERWTGCYETYRLTPKEGITNLKAEVDAIGKYAEWMKKTFPPAMHKIKKLSENK